MQPASIMCRAEAVPCVFTPATVTPGVATLRRPDTMEQVTP
jgi:hypothetical protein